MEGNVSRYKGKRYCHFTLRDQDGCIVTQFGARFNKRDGFDYCYGRRLVEAKDKMFQRRPTWEDLASASIYMIGCMNADQGTEFGKLENYSIEKESSLERDQEADLRFSPVLVGKNGRVPIPVTIEDTGEILEDSFHLSYHTAMKTLLLLIKMQQKDGKKREEKLKMEVKER